MPKLEEILTDEEKAMLHRHFKLVRNRISIDRYANMLVSMAIVADVLKPKKEGGGHD